MDPHANQLDNCICDQWPEIATYLTISTNEMIYRIVHSACTVAGNKLCQEVSIVS